MMTIKEENDYTAIVQYGYAVFGIGKTYESAIEDAKQFVDDPDILEDEIANGEYGHDGDMVALDCTEAYYKAVNKGGSAYEDYYIRNMIVMTPDEAEKFDEGGE